MGRARLRSYSPAARTAATCAGPPRAPSPPRPGRAASLAAGATASSRSEEHLVGGEATGLVQEPLAAVRHRQAGAPGPIFLRHFLPASRLPWDPELREPVPPGPAAPARSHRGGYQAGRPHLDHYRRAGPSPPRLACLAGGHRTGRAGITGRRVRGDRPRGAAAARAGQRRPGHRHRRGRPDAWRPGGMDSRGRPGGARLRRVGRGDRPAGGRPPRRGAGPGRDLARSAVGAFRRRLPARPRAG